MVPDEVRSLLEGLRFDRCGGSLSYLSQQTLDFADRNQLTPLLTQFDLSPQARAYAQAALARNTLRVKRLADAYAEIAPAFDHLVLKGFTHVPDFVEDSRLRVQYDLDLYVPLREREGARDALERIGYLPISGMDGLAMDHLPTMIRKTGWEWRGDYFDPDMPPSVEIHFQFWDSSTDRLYPEGLDGFWHRRNGARLDRVDVLGYAALHLTRHLLRGNVRIFHVWELAHFLNMHDDPEFWTTWERQHPPSLRRLEAVAFLLAHKWFGCRLSAEARKEIEALPESVKRWFEIYGWSPIEQMFRAGKREMLLHLSLVESTADRLHILRLRLVPATLPAPIDAIHLPEHRVRLWRRLQERARYVAYISSRAARHLLLFAPSLWSSLRWWATSRR